MPLMPLIEFLRDLSATAWRIWTAPGSLTRCGVVLAALGVWYLAHRRDREVQLGALTTDAVYSAFYLGSFYVFFIGTPLFSALTALLHPVAPFLELSLISKLPPVAQVLVVIVVMDFFDYWWHRWAHSSPTLWTLHRIHHSQRTLSPLTNFRFHVGDMVVRGVVQLVPAAMIGASAGTFLVGVVLVTALNVLAHADLSWSYGWFGRVLVSPQFHRIHHSVEEPHHHSNYGLMFSAWDFLFGTASRAVERPAAYGVVEHVPSTFVGQLFDPLFLMVRRMRGRKAVVEARSAT